MGSMINTLMGKQISEIKENGEIRATKDITEHYFIYDNVVIDNCEDSSNDGSYKIKSISSNIIAKYNCAMECYNSSASVLMISSMLDSNKTVNASNTSSPSSNTTSKIVSSYVCAVVNDCPASNRSIEYVKASACTSSNNTYCDNSVLYVFIRVMNKDGTDVSSFVARNSNNGKISCEISRMGGEILSIDGNNQRSGTLLDIKANKMQNGIGMHIHNMESDTLTSGSLLQISTKTKSPENGIVRINSNNVQSGKILSIEADELTSGNAIEVSHKGNGLTTGSLLHLNSSASNAQNGIANVVGNNIETGNVVAIEGNSLTTGSLLNLKSHSSNLIDAAFHIDTSKMSKGKGIVMGLSEMTEGTGIEINDNTKLTSGKLLDIRTTSSNAQNPVSISAPQISNGKVVDISSDGLTSGSAMVLSTNNGSSMINTLMGEKISEIKANGEIRTRKDISENLFIYDNIILDKCEDSSNDGSYRVKSITTNIIGKYKCSVECYNSSVVVTTTTSAPSPTTTTNASNITNITNS